MLPSLLLLVFTAGLSEAIAVIDGTPNCPHGAAGQFLLQVSSPIATLNGHYVRTTNENGAGEPTLIINPDPALATFFTLTSSGHLEISRRRFAAGNGAYPAQYYQRVFFNDAFAISSYGFVYMICNTTQEAGRGRERFQCYRDGYPDGSVFSFGNRSTTNRQYDKDGVDLGTYVPSGCAPITLYTACRQ